MSDKSDDPVDKVSIKDDARDSRFKKLRKNNEEVCRKKLIEEAKTKCIDQLHELGICAQSQGLLSIFNCKAENLKCIEFYSIIISVILT